MCATRYDYINRPSQKEIVNLCYGVHNLLEPARAVVACPIIVTSGFRCAALNKAVGGVSNSQHLTGNAADIKPSDPTKFDALWAFLSAHPLTDQLLGGRGWLHVSWCIGRQPRNYCKKYYYNY